MTASALDVLAQDAGTGSALSGLLFPLVIVLGLYLLIIRPQRARSRQLAAVQSAVVPGSRVITTAGLHATVVSLDGDALVLEIAPGVHATFATQAVVRLLDEPAAENADDGPAA